MTTEQNAPRQHDSLIKKPLGLVRSGPHAELIAAAKTGVPNLQPEADNTSATDILSGGYRSQLGASGAGGNSAVVEVVTPGTGGSNRTPEGTENGTEGAQPPAEGSTPKAQADPKDAAAAPAAAATDANAANGSAPGTGDAAAKADAPAAAPQNADATDADGSSSSTPNASDSKQKESSSKKKKGLRKVVPW